ncbi:hypothetical protein CHLNCDRAFT_140753 [Chlorella variabilis]|uniref:Thiopurine S-methyltransferase n=1 Tax=Chlorella variabilis TaxID=554065 RepID=E1Z646_CHLVA|nr:hypothetical protein CHLNCDRAFT_140753 [Chlorella variabilis]EFN58584.1 hypothetical protein CHLNCDRAFT_140753 [Chlorella variabilis]|eukprot:XP_005850686.1 hypothetical protein CHLNCDRAFT_140753 [Chlorella variabilis]
METGHSAFDGSQASPALAHALASGDVSVAGKRVLVPGCGRGYDVVEFARSGAQYTAGLELVPQAQQEAANYVAGQLSEEGGARAQVFVGDFFKWQHESVPSWDVGYDYTFMCALHPTMRPDWAAAWARYLAQPGSQLVCLAFPLNSDSETGPPWAVTVQQYKDLLRPHGFVCEREEPVPPERSHAGRGGRECMLVFSRQ